MDQGLLGHRGETRTAPSTKAAIGGAARRRVTGACSETSPFGFEGSLSAWAYRFSNDVQIMD